MHCYAGIWYVLHTAVHYYAGICRVVCIIIVISCKMKMILIVHSLLYSFWFIFLSTAMHIQCSDTTYQLLCKLGGFTLETRGTIEVKVVVYLKYY